MFKRRKAEIPPCPDDPLERHRYALETLDLVEQNWGNVYAFWRWRKWYRMHRIITARNEAVEASLERDPY